ncbi:MAG: DUF1080 domain-containing protein [Verrucomicrobiales bacterium]|nr:DUF1080 domain-containing protein [Verrucomicrobiales bacterium]
MIIKKSTTTFVAALFVLLSSALNAGAADSEGFVSIFNGKDLSGWKAGSENPDSFAVKDGLLVVDGPRCHLFYTGEVGGADFKGFELKLKAKTTKGSNGGVYFHTKFQDEGWPKKGYEAQVNSTHGDPKKTGSLYAVKNIWVGDIPKRGKNPNDTYVKVAPSKDGEWFDYHIIVKGKTIEIKVNGKTTVKYTEPADGSDPIPGNPGRKLSSGTIALQAHDAKSVVYYKNIRLKVTD